MHPGGRAYEDAPVNAAAAEARRSERFEARGHTPGRIDVAGLWPRPAPGEREFPVTLDLRLPHRRVAQADVAGAADGRQ